MIGEADYGRTPASQTEAGLGMPDDTWRTITRALDFVLGSLMTPTAAAFGPLRRPTAANIGADERGPEKESLSHRRSSET